MNDNFSPTKEPLGFVIYRTALALKSALQRFFKEHGFEITVEQWAIIRHLWEEDGLSQREIAEKTSKDKPNITRMVDALEQKRLVFRQPDPRDRRKYCIYLTKEGKHLPNSCRASAHWAAGPMTRVTRASGWRWSWADWAAVFRLTSRILSQ